MTLDLRKIGLTLVAPVLAILFAVLVTSLVLAVALLLIVPPLVAVVAAGQALLGRLDPQVPHAMATSLVVAFLAAWRSMPAPPPGRSASVDVPGAVLLAGGLLGVLLLASETGL